MKEKIENLIEQYKESRQEVFNLLDELNQINITKLNYKENDSLREHKIKLSEGLYMRNIMLSDLQSLL
jgi:hypothetical protein